MPTERGLLLLLPVAACTGGGDSGAPATTSLVDPAAWEPLDAAADPSDHRPGAVDCPSSAWGVAVEEGSAVVLEVDTGACDYLALVQPAQAAVAPGDTLTVRLGHGELSADAPAEGHSQVWLGGAVIWDQTVAIPAPAAEHTAARASDTAVPVGAPVVLHLHNHGANTWTLVEIGVTPAAP